MHIMTFHSLPLGSNDQLCTVCMLLIVCEKLIGQVKDNLVKRHLLIELAGLILNFAPQLNPLKHSYYRK